MKGIIVICVLILLLTNCSTSEVECRCCDRYVDSDKAKTIDDEYFCNECYYNTKECYGCGKRYIFTDDPQLNYCYSCSYNEQIVTNCEWCGIGGPVDYFSTFNGDPICARCLRGKIEDQYHIIN